MLMKIYDYIGGQRGGIDMMWTMKKKKKKNKCGRLNVGRGRGCPNPMRTATLLYCLKKLFYIQYCFRFFHPFKRTRSFYTQKKSDANEWRTRKQEQEQESNKLSQIFLTSLHQHALKIFDYILTRSKRLEAFGEANLWDLIFWCF